MRRWLVVAGISVAAVVGLAPAASAHPLGNFTVNFADRVLVGADSVEVLHAVDTAEIPTLQLGQAADGPDADHDGTTTPQELAAYAGRSCATVAGQLQLTLDGRRAPLTVTASSARMLPGAAGLMTSRLDCTFRSQTAARSTVVLSDPTSAGRTGWKEISATALCGSLTGTGGLPAQSPSKLLTAYPQDLLTSPLDVTRASFGVRASGGGACRVEGSSVPAPSSVLPRGVDRLTTGYTSFVSRRHLTLPVALLAVLLSVLLGSAHAVAPGHGKTVIAAYLVGQRGTKRQAAWLGATVTATHTAGVLLLGALLSLTSIAAPERFVPATEVASGLLLGGVGVFLLRRAVRARAGAGLFALHGHDHGDHAHGDHDQGDHGHGGHGHHDHDHGQQDPHDVPADDPQQGHGHDHGHDHGHPAAAPVPSPRPPLPGTPVPDGAGRTSTTVLERPAAPVVHSHGGKPHTHAPLDDVPLGWRTLATMGVAGGLVPSPSALVVLLGASALGRPVFGALLVVGYGLGMAITLTVAGLLLLRAQAVLARRGWTTGRGARVLRVLPVATAVIVLLVGAGVVLRGIITFRGLG